MTPYWLVMGARIYARQAVDVGTGELCDAEGCGWVPLAIPGSREWSQAHLVEAEARAAARANALRDVERAERELERARSELAALDGGAS